MNRISLILFGSLLTLSACDDSASADDKTDEHTDEHTDHTMHGDDDDDDTEGFTGVPGDCSVTLPADVEVISGPFINNSGGMVAWLCDGAEVVNNSGDGLFFVEGGAELANNSNAVDIWALSGSEVSTTGNTVNITSEAGAEVTDNGGTTLSDCATIEFDTSLVSGGC